MPDIFKQFLRHMNVAHKAAIADAAGRAIAEHCDRRIDAARTALAGLVEDCRGCADIARDEGNKSEARTWRAIAARIAAVRKKL